MNFTFKNIFYIDIYKELGLFFTKLRTSEYHILCQNTFFFEKPNEL